VLLADGAEAAEVGLDVLEDLDRAGERHVAVAGRVVDHELDPRVAAEDPVLHPGAGGGDVEAHAVPEEPVRGDVRAAVLADAGDDHIAGFGQEGFKSRARGHGSTLIPVFADRNGNVRAGGGATVRSR
jgi:hypothetical protein